MKSDSELVSPSRLRGHKRKRFSTSYDREPFEQVWGVELSDESPEVEWSMQVAEEDTDGEKSDRDYMMHQLFIKVASLGPGIQKGEEHVVEMETIGHDNEPVKMPVVNLLSGMMNMVTMDLRFTDKNKVTLRLIAGTGPIYLHGFCLIDYPEDVVSDDPESFYTETETTATDETGESDDGSGEEAEDDDEDEEDLEDEEDEEEEVKVKGKGGKKRKTISPAGKGNKAKQRGKFVSKEDNGSDSEEEEDEEEEAMDTGPKKKGRTSVSPGVKGAKGKGTKKVLEKSADKKKGKKGRGK